MSPLFYPEVSLLSIRDNSGDSYRSTYLTSDFWLYAVTRPFVRFKVTSRASSECIYTAGGELGGLIAMTASWGRDDSSKLNVVLWCT